ncbi:MAG: hypothetical protein FD121_1110, partial [Gallionellaceae bacterium]
MFVPLSLAFTVIDAPPTASQPSINRLFTHSVSNFGYLQSGVEILFPKFSGYYS